MSDPMLTEMIARGDRIAELNGELLALSKEHSKLVKHLSALGDPVVVAEALPELVEAAMKSAHLLKNHFEADPEGMGTMANDAALRTLTALAKLKARP